LIDPKSTSEFVLDMSQTNPLPVRGVWSTAYTSIVHTLCSTWLNWTRYSVYSYWPGSSYMQRNLSRKTGRSKNEHLCIVYWQISSAYTTISALSCIRTGAV